jgi:hypothetical protein
MKIIPVCGEKHRLAKKGKIKFTELKDEKMIIFRNVKLHLDLCAQDGLKPYFILNSPDKNIVNEILATGQMFIFGVESHVTRHPAWVGLELEDIESAIDCNLIERAKYICRKN